MLNHLEALCALPGASGNEGAVRTYIQAQIGESATCSTDALGNLIVCKRGVAAPQRKLMLAAHMDEVGMMVTAIRSDGSLRIAPVGGVDAAVLLGRQVLVGEQAINGVVGARAVHKLSADARGKAPACEELSVDIGALDAAEAAQVVAPGDYVHLAAPFTKLGNGRVTAKAIDDRLGCAILLDLLQQPLAFDTWFVFNVQEEVGLRGARASAFSVQPDFALVLETTTAADIHDVSDEKRVCSVGGGAVVSFMDRSTLYDRELYRLANETAAELGIPVQTKTMIAGGNDSGAIHLTASGVRTLAISAPCRYLHSPSTVGQYSDFEACERLAQAMMERIWSL